MVLSVTLLAHGRVIHFDLDISGNTKLGSKGIAAVAASIGVNGCNLKSLRLLVWDTLIRPFVKQTFLFTWAWF